MTVFLPPKDKANGTAVVVCPGGGHRLLVWTAEGIDPAKFLNSLGVTVFVLKYRLGRDTLSPYKIEVHARQDGLRAMRLVRSRATEFGIDTARIGLMGFSAGGEVVDMVTFRPNKPDANAPDPIDRQSAEPNFVIQIYPGPLFIPDTIPHNSPPAFLLAANDDPCCSISVMKLLEAYRAAKVPVEAHLFTQGQHGFNMGYRSKLKSISTWPQRLADWLSDYRPLGGGCCFFVFLGCAGCLVGPPVRWARCFWAIFVCCGYVAGLCPWSDPPPLFVFHHDCRLSL